jgi:hypothetical protein
VLFPVEIWASRPLDHYQLLFLYYIVYIAILNELLGRAIGEVEGSTDSKRDRR